MSNASPSSTRRETTESPCGQHRREASLCIMSEKKNNKTKHIPRYILGFQSVHVSLTNVVDDIPSPELVISQTSSIFTSFHRQKVERNHFRLPHDCFVPEGIFDTEMAVPISQMKKWRLREKCKDVTKSCKPVKEGVRVSFPAHWLILLLVIGRIGGVLFCPKGKKRKK